MTRSLTKFVNIIRVNFIVSLALLTFNYHDDYIDEILNDSQNVYQSYDAYNTSQW